MMESRNHLFFYCSIASVLRGKILLLNRLNKTFSSWEDVVTWACNTWKGKSLISTILKLAWCANIYVLWEECNRRIFKGCSRTAEELLNNVKDFVGIKLRGKNINRLDYVNSNLCTSCDEKTDSISEDGVFVEIKKLGGNSRRIRSKIGIEASLDTVWKILTDYEKLADVIPGLAVSRVIGPQSLPLGLKFNAKGVIDCYEKDVEILPNGKKREIQFKMVEGDFTNFEGTWLIEQFNRRKGEDDDEEEWPKMWLPVRLVEGRLSKEIKTNLLCIREEAKRERAMTAFTSL
ncbi:hypothetical protein F3Y22_tig00111398pilonHSYRG00150 [Hibiscus syriacus]|uniref:Coenzyme Q-binding protein COQ10 START domain-containing protein n=1 Tax=Hibiscus syriacus TaxID=106335 RepID=A0A6A2XV58_HIBSY|nr:hypothetical protein F3Y22_tig00111398pilonHSYRG00150 [Hibiscus syriacus]